MNKKNLADYYPVYKEIDGKPGMLNAEELVDRAIKCGYNTFQIAILLIKNAFEGHTYLNYQIRPDQLYKQGTFLLKEKPELLLLNFYENFAQYWPGLLQIEKYLKAGLDDLNETSFEVLLQHIVSNHIIRFPVSIFSAFDVRTLKGLPLPNQKMIYQQLALVVMCEQFLGLFELVDKVDQLYIDKFNELGQQLRLKEEVFTHFQKKFLLAPNVQTIEELEDLMYQKLIEEKLNCSSQYMNNLSFNRQKDVESSSAEEQFREKIKILYRAISKNCAEVHTSTNSEESFPELNGIFLKANTIYNIPGIGLPGTVLNYMLMTVILAKVLVHRKSEDLKLAGCLSLISGVGGKQVIISNEDLRLLKIRLDDHLTAYRINRFYEYKIKFVIDDELTEVHKHFLQQQIEYIDSQIAQIQRDIKEILKLKSQIQKA